MRIVSLTPIATETLVLLGLEDELVGVTPYCRVYLRRPEDKAIAGTCLKAYYDKIAELRPDIIFTQAPVEDRVDERLRELGYRTFKVRSHTNVHDIIANVVDIGLVTGRAAEARELAFRLEERLQAIYRRTSGRRARPRVFVDHFWHYKSSSTVGALTYVDDGVWIAGGVNIFHDVQRGFFDVDYGEVARRDPDIVIVSFDPVQKLTVEKYAKLRPVIAGLRAYREGRVYLVPESRRVNLNHPGPSFVDTIEYLEGLLSRAAKS